MMSKIDKKLFSAHEQTSSIMSEPCPKCGAGLSFKQGKHGSFIGCDGYPACDYHRSLVQHESMQAQVISGSECPRCGHELAVKSGRFGFFIGCTHYPECDHIEKQDQSYDQADIACPVCDSGKMDHRTNRFGKNFYACNQYPQCKFVVNYPPVAKTCPSCGFKLLVERNGAGGKRVECPQKACKYKLSIEE